jgi:hypothetical protein
VNGRIFKKNEIMKKGDNWIEYSERIFGGAKGKTPIGKENYQQVKDETEVDE